MLVARTIEKSFGPNRVLVDANLRLDAGEVHALLGANGAGKSTLSRIVAGQIERSGGSISFKGQPVNFASPRDGLRAGISVVMQETSLAPDLSVLDNIFLPSFAMPGRLSRRSMRQRASALIDRLGQTGALSLDQEARALSAAQRQLVEIAKALAFEAALIIFDEPTAALSPREVDHLFRIIDQLRKEGHAIAFVSHRLEEVLTLTDKVTVIRDGRSVAESVPTETLNQPELIRLMVGQELGTIYTSRRDNVHDKAEIVLEVQHLAAPPLVQDISFRLHKGEILGLGGLVGSGRSETVEAIFGLRPRSAGTILLNGEPFTASSPAEALRAGIALVPEDRRRQSIVPDFTVSENLLLGHLGTARGVGLGYRRMRAKVDELLRMLDVAPERLAEPSLLNFSGGMQQKIIIARWLLLEPSVLILDEPTKGIDIATRSSIYKLLQEIADGGVSILVISSDFEELLGLCERVAIVSDGMTIADVPSKLVDEEQLTMLAAPRTSMARTQVLLQELASEFGGHSFWGLVDQDRMICLADSGGVIAAAAPSLRAGTIVRIEGLPMASAFAGPRGVFSVTDGGRAILVDVNTARGHGNGVVGLTIGGTTPPPPVSAVRERIAAAFEQIGEP